MADDELELDVNESKGSGKKIIIMVFVGVLLLNGIGVSAWLFLSGGDDKTSPKEEVSLGPLKYLTMVPEFVVNFGPNSKVRYLQVDLQISTRQEDSLSTVGTYRPVIRNDILVVLSDVNFEDLKYRAGKEMLQKKLLKVINKVVNNALHPVLKDQEIKDKDGKVDGLETKEDVKGPIENVYFTSFIMQ